VSVMYQSSLLVLRLDRPPGKSFIIHPKTLSTTYFEGQKRHTHQRPINGEQKTFYFLKNISQHHVSSGCRHNKWERGDGICFLCFVRWIGPKKDPFQHVLFCYPALLSKFPHIKEKRNFSTLIRHY
jgi:hypothetical protein